MNGSARFAEIATQTINFTNLLSTFNKSLTNCNHVPFADNHNNSSAINDNTTLLTSSNIVDNNNKVHVNNGQTVSNDQLTAPPLPVDTNNCSTQNGTSTMGITTNDTMDPTAVPIRADGTAIDLRL